MTRQFLRRLLRSALTLPRPRDVLELFAAAALLGVVVIPVGLRTGLLALKPRPLSEILPLALSAFLIPAIGEEAPFRGALIPDRDEGPRWAGALVFSTALFCLWHVVEATLILPRARPLFLRPDFLAWTVLLGLACAVLRRRSGSLWPPVLLHWAAVVAWQGWLGGPGLHDLS